MKPNKADIIRQQIGMGVLMRLGAREFVGDQTTGFLQFRVGPGRPHRKIRIQLMPSDTYQIILLQVQGAEVKTLEYADGVYCDQLPDLLVRWESCHLCS